MANNDERSGENTVRYNSGPSQSQHTQSSRRSSTTGEALRRIIAEEIFAAMANFKPQPESRRETVPVTPREEASNNYKPEKKHMYTTGCSYKTFMGCHPAIFYGKKGAIEAQERVNQTESVLDISNCADEDKIRYPAHLFREEALKWWKIML
jgi:hypothetical protein